MKRAVYEEEGHFPKTAKMVRERPFDDIARLHGLSKTYGMYSMDCSNEISILRRHNHTDHVITYYQHMRDYYDACALLSKGSS